MPELPELEVMAEKLTKAVGGKTILEVDVHNHIVLYGTTVEKFTSSISGTRIDSVRADGKFLTISLSGSKEIVVNPMLTGRLRLVPSKSRLGKTDAISLELEDRTLVYRDRKQMGRVYLVKEDDYSIVADFHGRGPSALDPDLTLEIFRSRIRRHRGQIKNVLRNQRFVKGIGNAYADEILLFAGINPFRKRATLSQEDVDRLYKSMRKVLTRIVEILSERSLDEIGLEKRDFLMVHNRGGDICPLCGGRVSEVKANRFKTNYCQTCQL